MDLRIDLQRLQRCGRVRGEDNDETAELQKMAASAESYLRSHDWCAQLNEGYLAFGVGRVFALFLFQVSLGSGDSEWLWTVVGDVPSAYFVTDATESPADAIEVYVSLMRDWIDAVRAGDNLDHVFPVRAPADEKHAAMLGSRLRFLMRELVPASAAAYE